MLEHELGESTVGREDRLVRACVAFSLLLLAGFAAAASGGVGVIIALFLGLGVYFALTAATGRDPLYARLGIDTRKDVELQDSSDQATEPPTVFTFFEDPVDQPR